MYGTPDLPQQREKAHAEHVKEVSHEVIWLEVYRHVFDHIESKPHRRSDEPTDPIEWRLCASATQVGDEVEFRCHLEGHGPPGCARWVAATFFLCRNSEQLESTVEGAKLVAGEPTYIYSGTHFVWREKHLSYISPVLHNLLEQNTSGSEEIILDDTAEAFITFMKAVLPGPREPIRDSTIQILYRMAVKYNVKFLIEKCELHLLATKAMTTNEKVLLASELRRTEIVDDIIAGATREPNASEDIFHKGEQDDVEFTAGGRSIFTNKEYVSYHSTMLRGMLQDHFHQGNSNQDNIQRMPVSSNTDDFVLFMRAISPCQLDITNKNVQKLYKLADYYGARFLEKSCEKHMLTTKGIPMVERLITAQSLNKTNFITGLIADTSSEDVSSVLCSPRKTELSEDIARQLRDHYIEETKVVIPSRRLIVPIRSASTTVSNRRASSSDDGNLLSTTSSESSSSSSSSDTSSSSF